MKKGIIGAGGFGREVYWSLNPIERNNTVFFVDDEYWDNTNERILPLSLFDTNKYEDFARQILGNKAYLLFSFDKLIISVSL